eukprot:UN24623
MFFQMCLCMGIWTVGLVVQCIRHETAIFEPYAMLGGLYWALGNVCVTPIIKCIGMGLGLLIWGAAGMLTGWSMGYWGLFGAPKSAEAHVPWLNILGIIMALVGMGFYFFIQPPEKKVIGGMKKVPSQIFHHWTNAESPAYANVIQKQISSIEEPLDKYKAEEDYDQSKSWIDQFSTRKKQLIGISLSLFSGL